MNNNFLDNLAIMANVFQVANYTENLQQSNNDDIMKQLQLQNQQYLEVILNQNNFIINLLKELKGSDYNGFKQGERSECEGTGSSNEQSRESNDEQVVGRTLL